jgi:hypothetical protein
LNHSIPENLNSLLQMLILQAERTHDGHLTIMRFTTGWKVVCGTPSLDQDGWSQLQALPNRADLAQSIRAALVADLTSEET